MISHPEFRPTPSLMNDKLHAFAITLENRLFQTTTLASLFIVLALVPFSLLYEDTHAGLILEMICLVVFGAFHLAGRDLQRAERLRTPFLISLWMLLNAGFFTAGGLGDSYINIILVAVIITLILIPNQRRLQALFTMSGNLIVMIAAEYLWPDLRRILGPEHRFQVISTSHIFLAISYIAVVIIVVYMKSRYDELRSISIEQNGLMKQINDALNLINDDLKRKNDAIAVLNASLETKVEIRTAEIRAYQKRLLDIAFFQSHRMRGPLANILGMLALLHDEKDILEMQRMNTLMKAEAHKLDDNLREMQQVLDNSGNGIRNDVF